jgi:DNA-directed RNA polymerase specialized sigma54-like protein
MAIKPGLQLKLGQHLALTPQLQQSIRLLQLSSLELSQEIEQALNDNPLLECDDPSVGAAMRIASDGAILGSASAAPAPAEPSRTPAREKATTSTGFRPSTGAVPEASATTTTKAREPGSPPRRRCAST